jgi:gustatory receptor
VNQILKLLKQNFLLSKPYQVLHESDKYYRSLLRKEIIYAIICFSPIIFAIIDFTTNFIQNGTEKFVVEIWFPFDTKVGIFHLIACAYIAWTAFLSFVALYSGDWIFYSFIAMISMEFDSVGSDYNEIFSYSGLKINQLKNIIDEHIRLIEASNILQDIFSNVILLNFFHGSTIICLIIFQVIMMDNVTQIMVYVAILGMIMSQIFLLCHHGQMLIDASKGVNEKIYLSNWYDIRDNRVRKIISLIIQLSQQGKSLNGHGFVVICHETFTTVSY